MKKYIADFTVVNIINYPANFFTLVLKSDKPLPEIQQGQFVEVSAGNELLLRRPISVHDVDYKENTLHLLIQIVGKGTRKLSEIKIGEQINLVYPLGKPFSLQGKNVLLVGGGCGVAPLLYLTRKFKEKGISPTILLGGRTKDHIPALNEFEKYGNVHISTEDGSMGEKGLVTQHSIFGNTYDRIFTCGPNPMMKAIARNAVERNIACELSLENTMACGIGACLCCVVDSDQGHVCVCKEGPVFEATQLTKWINN